MTRVWLVLALLWTLGSLGGCVLALLGGYGQLGGQYFGSAVLGGWAVWWSWRKQTTPDE